MPMNKIPKLREPRGPVVKQVRDLLLEGDFKETPDEYYSEDIRLIENMDFLLQRCVIMQRKDVDGSVKMVSQLLKWRKERRLYDLHENQFPQELQMCGGVFIYENDKFGNRTLYLRGSMCKNCPELKVSMKDFLTMLVFQLDDPKAGTTFSVILDLTDTTWSNYDLDLLMHFVTLLKDYFPVNLDYVLAINFPWILSAAWTLIKRLIPAEKRDVVQFINSDKIFDYVEKENCPDFLGGTCSRPYKFVNNGAPTAIEFLAMHENIGGKPLSKKRLREILNTFSDILPKDYIKRMKSEIDKLKDGVKLEEQICLNNNDKFASNNNNNNFEEINRVSVVNDAGNFDKKKRNKRQEAK